MSFNTVGEDDGGTVLATKGEQYSGPPCGRCGRPDNPTKKCFANRHVNCNLLHIEGKVEEEWEEYNDQVSYTNLIINYQKEMHALTFLQSNNTRTKTLNTSSNTIPDTWIMLDSQSTIDVFCNKKLLTWIHATKTTMNIKCNARVTRTNLRGHLSGYGLVCFFPDGIGNILSMSRVKEKFRATYDIVTDNSFQVHKGEEILKFKEATRRLYYFDTPDCDEESTMIITIAENKENEFSAYDFLRAKLARSIQNVLGGPGCKTSIATQRTIVFLTVQ